MFDEALTKAVSDPDWHLIRSRRRLPLYNCQAAVIVDDTQSISLDRHAGVQHVRTTLRECRDYLRLACSITTYLRAVDE